MIKVKNSDGEVVYQAQSHESAKSFQNNHNSKCHYGLGDIYYIEDDED